MTTTRVTVVSSDREHLHEITGILKRAPVPCDIQGMEAPNRLPDDIGHAPDVLIINGALAENGHLDALERLGHRHPETALIVVSGDNSPDFLLKAMRAGVREVLPAPLNESDVHAAIERVKKRAAPAADGRIFAFISCKGGAGSTFLATNFGYVLAGAENRKVAFIDLNLQFGDAALFVSEQRPAADVAQLCREIHRLDASLLAASMVSVLPNYGVLAAPEDPGHAIDVSAKHVETILKLARKHYDYVVIDLGRSLDAVSLQALDIADLIFPVLQLSLPFVRDGRRLLGVLRSLGYAKSKINLLVNRYEKDGEIKLADLEGSMGMPVYKTIPNSYQAVVASVNQGIPIVRLARNDPVSRGLCELAHAVAPQPAREEAGWLSRMLGRA